MSIFISILSVLLVLSTLAQLVVWYWGFGIFNWKTKAGSAVLAHHPSASQEPLTVIVCARNEAENLKASLPFVLNQRYPNFEVLVVNDASEDGTKAVLENFSTQYSNLRTLHLVHKETEGKKGALAQGVAAAQTDWIVVTDADCRPASDKWLDLMAGKLGEGADLVLGYGPLRESEGWLNAWARYEVFITALQYFSFYFWGHPYMGVGRNMAWKKSLYEQTGGFAQHVHITSGDDDLFVNEAAPKARVKACLLPDSFVYSDAKPTLKTYFRQKQRHLSTGKFYHWTHRLVLGFAALSHSCHYLFVATLFLAQSSMVFALVFYVIRLVTIILTCRPALRVLKAEKLWHWLPLFDLLLPVFYTLLAPSIFLHKNNRPRSWT